jgi:hypothetical protein
MRLEHTDRVAAERNDYGLFKCTEQEFERLLSGIAASG